MGAAECHAKARTIRRIVRREVGAGARPAPTGRRKTCPYGQAQDLPLRSGLRVFASSREPVGGVRMDEDRVRVELAGELAQGPRGRVYRAVLIRPGEWQGKGIRCSAEVLERAAPLFEGLASFLNPPGPVPGQHGYPGLERLLGVTENARWDDQAGAIVADYRLADTDTARWFQRLVDGWLRDKAAGRPAPAIGLSAVPWVRLGPKGADGLREVAEIVGVDQVDAVYKPAAGGEFVQVLAAVGSAECHAKARTIRRIVGREDVLTVEGAEEEGSMSEREQAGLAEELAEVGEAAVASAAAEAGAASEVSGLVGALRESVLEGRLALSGLPERWRRVVRSGLPEVWTVEELDAGIERVRVAFAEEEAQRTVQGVRPLGGGVTGMMDSRDQITEALTALLEGRSPNHGVRPLTGIREAYLLLSGDYDMRGVFDAERVPLANVTSTTMASITANVLNKLVVTEFQKYPKWWLPIVRTEAFSTLQTVRWITLGGVGELPTVAEGAAYTELSWDDAYETASWNKKGGYLGLTLEAMDKDDVGRLRRAPAALAQAAWLTLGKSISNIFTANSGVGPTLTDTGALFNSTATSTAGGHANLGTSALSTTSWTAARLAMRKQTELNSGERLGLLTTPKYLLVPPDLEYTALVTLASEQLPGGSNNDVNVYAEGNTFESRMESARKRVIVVDLWTDTNNWAAVADPRLYPTIGVGFRYGETPEIFSVASPTSGLMFSNDVFPVKVRWFYACGPMDFRGLYKANVA